MALWQVIVMFIVCGGLSFMVYGIWTLENDRDEFRKKHGYDPYRHGWIVEENDEDQGDGKK